MKHVKKFLLYRISKLEYVLTTENGVQLTHFNGHNQKRILEEAEAFLSSFDCVTLDLEIINGDKYEEA